MSKIKKYWHMCHSLFIGDVKPCGKVFLMDINKTKGPSASKDFQISIINSNDSMEDFEDK